MRPARLVCALAATAICVAVCLPGWAGAASKPPSEIGRYQLNGDAGSPAFEATNLGIFTFHLVVYGDGSVKLDKTGGRPTNCLRLLDPGVRLSSDTLNGLLTLAEAGYFFSRPAVIKSTGKNVDLVPQSLTVHTTTKTKAVTMNPPATDPAFNQLHSVLLAAAGLTLRCS